MNLPILSKNVIKKNFSNIGLKSGHALASFATYRILSEKLRFTCFSQVPTGSDYPASDLYCLKTILILPPNLMGSFRRISLKIFSPSYILKNIVYIKGEVWKLQD